MKYAWIDTQRTVFPLPAMVAGLEVSISGYRAWRRGGRPHRKRLTDGQLLALIQTIHNELKGAYGSPRMLREVRERGFPASKERVERLMRENGPLRARQLRIATVEELPTPIPKSWSRRRTGCISYLNRLLHARTKPLLDQLLHRVEPLLPARSAGRN